MNKRKILLGTGAFLIAAASAIAGRASAFLNTAPKLYFTTNGASTSCTSLLSSGVPSQFTTQPAAGVHQATILTSNNIARALFYTSGCTNGKVYFE
jgi:hypothetical protein